MSFDYFYGQQSDLFTFYRVPKVLFTNERFWNISADAKMLYGILLDRMSLSAKNGWIDKNGRVYIIFTIDEAKMALNCAEQKAIKLLSELEKKAGLIERKRQGLGKPNLIYVKNFISAVDSQLLNCENHNSGTMEITTQELPKSQCNNTDIKNTEFSDTDSIFPSGNGGMMDENDRYQEYFDYFSDQLSMDLLKKDYPYDSEMLDNILELIVETVCTKRPLIRTDQSRAEAQQERVQEIPLSELHPFEGHPFRVVDDEEMMKTAESVRDFGVLTPAIVRPDPDGGYEIVSGHRRHRASELAGKETMPAIVRDLDDDAAIILMVDANLQRESILPSERAFAYKMKLDAIKHQGQRTDLTSSQVGMKLQAMDIVGQEAGESRNQVHRYIRLTELIPELLDMVDTGQIKFNPAVELSYLASEEQKDFLSAMDYAQAAPSLSQAQRIKKLAQEGECTLDAMCEIMNEIKKGELDRVTFKTDSLRKYFPKSYTNKQMEDKIIQLLEQWQKKREKSMER